MDKVGILDAVAGVRQSEPHGVRAVLLDGRLQRLEVARGLGHLLAVEEQVPVGAKAARPLALVPLPNRGVIVYGKREVVLDEVLAGHAQVERVPEVELRAHLVEEVLRELRVGVELGAEEHGVPDVVGHSLRVHRGLRFSVHVPALEQVRDGVVGHVDGGVGEGLDEVLGVPGHAGSQAESAGARPLAEPAEGVLESLSGLVVVGDHALEALLGALAPGVLAVLEVPLVGERDDALVAGAGHHLLLGLGVDDGAAVGNHDVPNLLLDELHGFALVRAEEHDPIGETLEVGLPLGLLELDLLVLALDLELLAHDGRARVAKLGDVNARDNLEGHDPLILDAKLFPKRGLGLEIAEGHEVHGGVGRHGRHHAGTLVHEDGHHGEAVDPLEHRER